MFAVPIPDRRAIGRIASRGGTGIARLMLAAGLAGAAASAPAAEPACEGQDPGCRPVAQQEASLPLDQLSLTIGNLKASLSTIRDDLEAMRGGSGAEAESAEDEGASTDLLCAVPQAAREAALSELEELRTTVAGERDACRRAAAVHSEELAGVRARLAAAQAEVRKLRGDRKALVNRIAELDETIQQTGTGAAPATPAGRSVIESAAAADLEGATPGGLMVQVTQRERATAVSPPATGAGLRVATPVDRLQLQAELALAQLKIAELTTALEAARLRHEGMEAEVSTLRSLTDEKIKQLMGFR